MARSVDLNADLGEGYGVWRLGDDAALLDLVTSANLACGFHAGDPLTLDRTVGMALERGVRVGAQVSYPDLVGFGRRPMSPSPAELTADVLYQLGALAGFCRVHGGELGYVKAHGALYNRILVDAEQAGALIEAVRRYDPALALMTMPGSLAAQRAVEAGLTLIREGYADRGYDDDARLVARTSPGALLGDPDEVAQRSVRMVCDGQVRATGGAELSVTVDSVCLHGDTPGAVALARAVRDALLAAGVTLQA